MDEPLAPPARNSSDSPLAAPPGQPPPVSRHRGAPWRHWPPWNSAPRPARLVVRRRHRRATLSRRAAGQTALMFKNPAVDFTQVLFIDQPYPQGPGVHTRGRPSPGHDGRPRRPTAGAGRAATRAVGSANWRPSKPGSFWRPELSFDGRKVLFCYKAQDEKSFHLYEIGLDGTRPAATDRQRLRRHRPDLPARRAHPVHHHPRQYLRPLRALHLLVRPGPLRSRTAETCT